MNSRAAISALLAAVLIVGCASRVLFSANELPSADALRYITSSLNLVDHGVLSMAPLNSVDVPRPGLLAGGPLLSVELALTALIDSGTRETYVCALEASNACDVNLTGLKWLRLLEVLAFFVLLWGLATRILRSTTGAWIACFVAFACSDIFYYTGLALGESLHLLTATALFYTLVRATEEDAKIPHAVALGVGLGVAALAKPSATVWIPVMLLLLVTRRAWSLNGNLWPERSGLSMALIAGVVSSSLVGIWMIRNAHVGGAVAMADPAYLSLALAHRAGYNLMSWSQWAFGWIYYLPDFGDSLARDLFGTAATKGLGWGADGYYVYGRDTIAHVMQTQSESTPREYLLSHHIMNDPVKHVLVSVLLAFRGAFVGKYWGLLAWVATLWALRVCRGIDVSAWLVLLLSALALLGAQSVLSVSIPRYNLSLIPVLSIGVAALIMLWTRSWQRRLGDLSKSD